MNRTSKTSSLAIVWPVAVRRALWTLGVLLIGSGLLLSGCAGGERTPEPPDIRYGEDLCEYCTMIISEPRFAAAYAHEVAPGRYASLAFGDIGDMLAYAAEHSEDDIVAWYVHDYLSEGWIDATQAHYVVSEAIPSPMGYGIAALVGKEEARALADEVQGELLDWSALRQQSSAPHAHTR